MKTMRKILCIVIAIGFIVITAGCNLVQVNEEKDNKIIIAEVDGEKIQKEYFKNYLVYYELLYKSYGYT